MKKAFAVASLVILFGCSSSGHGGGLGQSIAASTSPTTPSMPIPVNTTPTTATTTPAVVTPPVTTPVVTPPVTTPSVTNPHLLAALAILNANRAKYGAGPLTLDPALCACALRHSQDLFNCTGGSFNLLLQCAHKDYIAGDTCGCFAENQACAPGPDIDQAFKQMDDQMMAEGPLPPGSGKCNHFGNITNPRWTQVGIGLYQDSNLNVWLTEVFK